MGRVLRAAIGDRPRPRRNSPTSLGPAAACDGALVGTGARGASADRAQLRRDPKGQLENEHPAWDTEAAGGVGGKPRGAPRPDATPRGRPPGRPASRLPRVCPRPPPSPPTYVSPWYVPYRHQMHPSDRASPAGSGADNKGEASRVSTARPGVKDQKPNPGNAAYPPSTCARSRVPPPAQSAPL